MYLIIASRNIAWNMSDAQKTAFFRVLLFFSKIIVYWRALKMQL